MNPCIRIAHLYPRLMNLYGDRGNLIALQHRAEKRGIQVEITGFERGESIPAAQIDLFFIGGGQDINQSLIQEDFLKEKGPQLLEFMEEGLPGLCICGGYQLMGKSYHSQSEGEMEGLGFFDAHTEAGSKRLVGDLVCEADFLRETGKDPILIGFENHAGYTYLGETASPLGKVMRGHGNNDRDKREGCYRKNIFGTYMHGSLLPKNPDFTDWLIQLALNYRYPNFGELPFLDKDYENAAREVLLKRFLLSHPDQGKV